MMGVCLILYPEKRGLSVDLAPLEVPDTFSVPRFYFCCVCVCYCSVTTLTYATQNFQKPFLSASLKEGGGCILTFGKWWAQNLQLTEMHGFQSTHSKVQFYCASSQHWGVKTCHAGREYTWGGWLQDNVCWKKGDPFCCQESSFWIKLQSNLSHKVVVWRKLGEQLLGRKGEIKKN